MDLGLLLGGIAAGSGGGDDIAFHTGVISSWDETTGVNTVTVSGTDMANLSVLSPSTTIGLRAGMTIGVLRVRTRYFILGKISAPGAGAALTTRQDYSAAEVMTGSTSYVDLGGPSIESVYIGSSHRALLFVSAEIAAGNAWGEVSVAVSGASTIAPETVNVSAFSGGFDLADSSSAGRVYVSQVVTAVVHLGPEHGLTSGMHTFTTMYRLSRSDGYTPVRDALFRARRLVVMPL